MVEFEIDSYIVGAVVSLFLVINSAELALKKFISLVTTYRELQATIKGSAQKPEEGKDETSIKRRPHRI
ncbi:MAG TPA: hypothetical protein VNO50_04095 [Pyrinomonadaceae bacterium]|nr:hypothetical protein [Pyrinomonadaceae bacterium]